MGLECSGSDCVLISAITLLPIILGTLLVIGIAGLIWAFKNKKSWIWKMALALFLLPGLSYFAYFDWISKYKELSKEIENAEQIQFQTYAINYQLPGHKLSAVTLVQPYNDTKKGIHLRAFYENTALDGYVISQYQGPLDSIGPGKCLRDYLECVRANETPWGGVYCFEEIKPCPKESSWIADYNGTLITNYDDSGSTMDKEDFFDILESLSPVNEDELKSFIDDNQYWKKESWFNRIIP